MARLVVAVVAVLAVAGCAQLPAATPTPAGPPSTGASLVAVSPQALGALIEEHFGPAYAVSDGGGQLPVQPTERVEGISATAYYRATPGAAERTITVGYSPSPLPSMSCPSADCRMQDGAYLRNPEPGTPDVLAPRAEGFVQVTVDAGEIPAEAVALALDPRIQALVDPNLAAAVDPRWRTDDLGCVDTAGTGLVPLPTPDGGAPEPATPQALAAVIASRVVTGCVGGRTTPDGVSATAFLGGADTERVELAVSAVEPSCAGLDSCQTRDGSTIGWQFDRPEEHPAKVRVWHRSDTGGWVVATQASVEADPVTKEFPVPLETLIGLVTDSQVGAAVDPALNRAGDALPLRWRLVTSTAE